MKALRIAGDKFGYLAHPDPGQVRLEAIKMVLMAEDRGRVKAAFGAQVLEETRDRAAERHLMVRAATAPVSGHHQLEHLLHRPAESPWTAPS